MDQSLGRAGSSSLRSASVLRSIGLGGVAAVALAVLAPPPSPALANTLEERVRTAALATYVHGMTAEIAAEAVGAEGVPVLLRLLADTDFPRRDNVVAFLTYLGGDEATDALLRFLHRPPARIDVPEEDRSILLAPQALGRIAGRGHGRALEALLAITAHGGQGGVLAETAAVSARPAALRDDLLEMALLGLADAGDRRATRRLADIARGRIVPAPGGRSLRRAALRAQRRGGTSAGSAGVSPDGVPAGVAGATSAVDAAGSEVAAASDTQSTTHESRLDYANHPAVTSPMTDARLDAVLAEGSKRVGRSDPIATEDVACCVEYARTGSAKTFGSVGDGLDIIDDGTELTAVLNDGSARFKVVRAINYCGSPGTNIIGCAWVGGKGVAAVRRSDLGSEAVLWVHEYGHNVGLSHNTTSSDYVMYGVDTGANRAVTQTECNRYHAPSSGAQAILVAVGVCADADGDGVQDGIDNCPGVANFDQLDADGDGVGDACESGCGNGVRDAAEECDGADLGGASCASLGYDGGSLVCTAACMLDRQGCYACGNGLRESGEQCDGADLGGATCAARQCAGGVPSCTTACTLDYASCLGCPVCDRDGLCQAGENCTGCPDDCISGSGGACGNGLCEIGNGENCLNCPKDCRGQQSGKPSGRYCCGNAGVNPVSCSDPRCTTASFRCTTTPVPDYCCGDGQCNGLENGTSCMLDCGPPPTCGDGACNGDETACSCPADCPRASEKCSDGLDNDCDLMVDCADADCAGAPGCVPTCTPAGGSCTSRSACCSGRCKSGRCR